MVIAAFLGTAMAAGVSHPVRLDDYNHAMWTEKDGVPGEISSLAQTPDGWLWIGTSMGLYRFDGVRFSHYALPGDPFVHNRIYELHAEANGDLWISYMLGGLSVLHKDGRIEDLLGADSRNDQIGAIAIDVDGSVWVSSGEGIRHYIDRQWHTVPIGPDWTVEGRSLLLDQYGRLWAAHKKGVFLLDRRSGRFERWSEAGARGSLIQSPDGRIWAADADHVQLIDAPPPAGQHTPPSPIYHQAEARWGGQFDRNGNLWALHCPIGLCLVPAAELGDRKLLVPSRQASARLDQHWQLSMLAINAALEDREGNMWLATPAGLDRFRENKLIPVRIPGGPATVSMARDEQGEVWADDRATGRLWRLPPAAPPVSGGPGFYSVIASARDGALLLAGKRSIERRYRGSVQQISLPPCPDGKACDLTVVGVMDDGKVLWFAAIEVGLMGLKDGKWLSPKALNMPRRIYQSANAGDGRIWLGMADGGLVFYDNGQQTHYDASAAGLASGIFPGTELLVSGDRGMGVLQGARFIPLHAADPDVLRNVSGLAVTGDGDHWFNGSMGIVHITGADWRAAMAQPERLLRYELLNKLEGYPGRAALDNRLYSVLDGGNGRLWFRATGGIVRLDTTDLKRNRVQPIVDIQRVSTARATYAGKPEMSLPPGSQNFTIEFTAPGLRRPEDMRFQYRLQGVDADWQTAIGQRAAYYTNMQPGRYQFAVRAINEDGTASASAAALRLDIEPRLTQTLWFRLACLLLVGVALYALYRYRVRVVATALAMTMTVRMEERERIARMLHDTILQSVQGMILRVHALSMELPADSAMRGKMNTLLDSADQTITEGRDQVHELRRERGDEGDLSAVITQEGRSLEELYPALRFSLSVSGAVRPLQPAVAGELADIAREAMRNAFRHSGGNAVDVVLDFSERRVALQVRDNGKGIAEAAAGAGGREGHWGMVGMRERAGRIGARLDIFSRAGAGATVGVVVPGERAYAAENPAWWRRLLAR
jgi:signal transduction histidine kinase/ligand-binding sensor domain-containing protein